MLQLRYRFLKHCSRCDRGGTGGAFYGLAESSEATPKGHTTMAMQVVWHGSQQESFDLVNAIARNCTCEFGLMGVRLATCAPHRMLTEDQRALNGLLFARRMAERLRREEFSRAKVDHAAAPAPRAHVHRHRLTRHARPVAIRRIMTDLADAAGLVLCRRMPVAWQQLYAARTDACVPRTFARS